MAWTIFNRVQAFFLQVSEYHPQLQKNICAESRGKFLPNLFEKIPQRTFSQFIFKPVLMQHGNCKVFNHARITKNGDDGAR